MPVNRKHRNESRCGVFVCFILIVYNVMNYSPYLDKLVT